MQQHCIIDSQPTVLLQDVRKAQSLGFAFDSGITIVEGDVTKGAR